ncbi:MAG: hypothetical protein M3042_06355 [Actinomycetota bacterium]|nr:hypothetical protein [Actinomycetota bacterium]
MYGKPPILIGGGLAVTGFYTGMYVIAAVVALIIGGVLLRMSRVKRAHVDR